eukprot:8454502-Karenia_brevis.AAC.1
MEDIVAKSDIFLGIPESHVLGKLYNDFCLHYNCLTMDSIAQKKLLYNQTPKMHVLQHSCFMHGFSAWGFYKVTDGKH